MQNFKLLFGKQSPHIPKWFAALFLFLSGAGFLDASYLAVKHYAGSPVVCSLLNGCDKVTTSQYAAIAGIPVSFIGALYYLAIFLLAMIYVDTGRPEWLFGAMALTPLGFLASLWFAYVQVFILRALCLYCLFSAFLSTILFVCALLFLRKKI